jgi:hypothetical protein
MKLIALATCVFLCSLGAIGCAGTSPPSSNSTATARIHVIAKPKAGVKAPLARVAVYDAAPSQSTNTGGGTYERIDYNNLADIMVWLEPKAKTTIAPPAPTDIVITTLHESDHVHPGSIGQTINFRNKTDRPLNLYSVSEGNEFELPTVAPGASATYVPKNEGYVEVLFDPARQPIAALYIAPSPWIAHTRSNKTVTFKDVPPGEYEIVTWHPRLPGSAQTIKLSAGQTSESTAKVGVNALSNASQ